MKKLIDEQIPTSVDDYLAMQPERVQQALQELRATIRKAAPQAEELISYRIPTYKLNGALVHFANFEKHCSFFVVSKSILEEFKDDLKKFKTSGTTIQFTPDNPLPKTLVTKIVKMRLTQNNKLKPASKKVK